MSHTNGINSKRLLGDYNILKMLLSVWIVWTLKDRTYKMKKRFWTSTHLWSGIQPEKTTQMQSLATSVMKKNQRTNKGLRWGIRRHDEWVLGFSRTKSNICLAEFQNSYGPVTPLHLSFSVPLNSNTHSIYCILGPTLYAGCGGRDNVSL